jgi:alpha-methylacyl-CoA racemase
MEKLNLGPDVCIKRNPKLVFGRMTGWGQEGPLAQAAGHDINYIALSGALYFIGRPGEKPVPPLNLIGDLGGGGMLLAFGIVCALLEVQKSGKGQVVDAAMIDGVNLFMGIIHAMRAAGVWSDERGKNILDGGAHFYNTYETRDGKWIAFGAIEPRFYKLLLENAGIKDPDFLDQLDSSKWIELKEKMTEIFKMKTREEWCRIMEGTDACFAPVLSLEEAPKHPHNNARRAFIETGGLLQPAPAPRFSRTRPEIHASPPEPGEHTESILLELGLEADEIVHLKQKGVI